MNNYKNWGKVHWLSFLFDVAGHFHKETWILVQFAAKQKLVDKSYTQQDVLLYSVSVSATDSNQ